MFSANLLFFFNGYLNLFYSEDCKFKKHCVFLIIFVGRDVDIVGKIVANLQ